MSDNERMASYKRGRFDGFVIGASVVFYLGLFIFCLFNVGK